MPSNTRGGGVRRAARSDRVLEQAGAVGVVVVLRGRRLAVGAAGRRGRAEQSGDQLGQVRVLDRGDQAVEVRAELADRALGPVEQVLPRDGVGRRAAQRLDRQLAAVARVLGERAADVHGIAGLERRRLVGVPQHGRDGAGAVGEHEPQIRGVVALVAALGLADEQDAVDRAGVDQVADERRLSGDLGRLSGCCGGEQDVA